MLPVPRDRGAASILLLAVGLFLVAASLGGMAVGAARNARHQARTAADLGALAGAAGAIYGEDAACAKAAQFVTRNRARLLSCTLSDLDVTVQIQVDAHPLPGLTRHARAAARAGPLAAPAT